MFKEILQSKLKYDLKSFLFSTEQGEKLLEAVVDLLSKKNVGSDYYRRLANVYILVDHLQHAGLDIPNVNDILYKSSESSISEFESKYFCYYVQLFQEEGALA